MKLRSEEMTMTPQRQCGDERESKTPLKTFSFKELRRANQERLQVLLSLARNRNLEKIPGSQKGI